MRHTSRHRSAPNPLAPRNAPTWLVVRDRIGGVIESTELAAGEDLRARLSAARDAKLAAGWMAEDIGPRCAFFFASYGEERVLVAIERIPVAASR